MIHLGYALSSEEQKPQDLIDHAVKAEQTGFEYALISDHFHPWISKQGQSPFVWSILGGISQKTKKLEIGTGVTCPTIRTHPVVIAHAAATAGALLEGRFFLGLGTGENLNEHVVGMGWPPLEDRQEMLIEATEIIKLLLEGGNQSYEGAYYTVEDARIYSLPETLPPIMIAASGPKSATIAGELSDGLISTSPNKDVIKAFQKAGGDEKPTYGQLTVCIAKTEKEGVQLAKEWWPTGGLPGQLSQELRTPTYFEQVSQLITEDKVAQSTVCSLDPQVHLQKIKEFASAGFDHVYIHQVGPDQDAFFTFYEKHIFPDIGHIEVIKPQKEDISQHVRVAL